MAQTKWHCRLSCLERLNPDGSVDRIPWTDLFDVRTRDKRGTTRFSLVLNGRKGPMVPENIRKNSTVRRLVRRAWLRELCSKGHEKVWECPHGNALILIVNIIGWLLVLGILVSQLRGHEQRDDLLRPFLPQEFFILRTLVVGAIVFLFLAMASIMTFVWWSLHGIQLSKKRITRFITTSRGIRVFRSDGGEERYFWGTLKSAHADRVFVFDETAPRRLVARPAVQQRNQWSAFIAAVRQFSLGEQARIRLNRWTLIRPTLTIVGLWAFGMYAYRYVSAALQVDVDNSIETLCRWTLFTVFLGILVIFGLISKARVANFVRPRRSWHKLLKKWLPRSRTGHSSNAFR